MSHRSASPETFGFMVRFVHRVAQDGARELLAFGLTPAQYQMLLTVRSRPGIAQRDLAALHGHTKGNVSQLVKKLEVAGLLGRDRVQGTDEVALTGAGTALLRRVVPVHAAFMERQFADLTSDEVDVLDGLLHRLSGE